MNTIVILHFLENGVIAKIFKKLNCQKKTSRCMNTKTSFLRLLTKAYSILSPDSKYCRIVCEIKTLKETFFI